MGCLLVHVREGWIDSEIILGYDWERIPLKYVTCPIIQWDRTGSPIILGFKSIPLGCLTCPIV